MRQTVHHGSMKLLYSAGTRSAVYFGGAIALLEGARRLVDLEAPDAIPRLHLIVFAPAMGWTALVATLEGQERPTPTAIRRGLVQALYGAVLGTGAWLLVLTVLRAKRWVRLPAWGWQVTSPRAVVRAIPMLILGHAAVASNEETLFRGYGYTTLREAIGPIGAISILIPLFGVYHGTSPQVLIGTSIGGALLTMLRLQTGAVWMGLGYHWAWNVLQTAVFGPSDGLPSLRPVEVKGPRFWVGRPGSAESGWVSILVTLGVAILTYLIGSRRKP